MIKEDYIIDSKVKKKIIEYFENYLEIKNNIYNHIDFKNSFYDDFKLKLLELIENSQQSISLIFFEYLKDIRLNIDYLFTIINSYFSKKKGDLENNYSIKRKEEYITFIKDFYHLKDSQKNSELYILKRKLIEEINNIIEFEFNDGILFKEKFNKLQNEINNLKINMKKYYIPIMFLKNILI